MRFLSLMVLLAPRTQGSTDHLNYGVSFKDLGPIEFSVDVWKHSYLIELPRDLKHIPDLKIFKHKMSGILAQDKKLDINLKQIAERVKNSSTIYNSISDASLDEQFSFDNGNPFDFKLLLSIVGLSLAVINFFTIIYVL